MDSQSADQEISWVKLRAIIEVGWKGPIVADLLVHQFLEVEAQDMYRKSRDELKEYLEGMVGGDPQDIRANFNGMVAIDILSRDMKTEDIEWLVKLHDDAPEHPLREFIMHLLSMCKPSALDWSKGSEARGLKLESLAGRYLVVKRLYSCEMPWHRIVGADIDSIGLAVQDLTGVRVFIGFDMRDRYVSRASVDGVLKLDCLSALESGCWSESSRPVSCDIFVEDSHVIIADSDYIEQLIRRREL